MTVKLQSFLDALNATTPLIGGKNLVCKSYYFTGERLITTDLDRIVSVPFATDFKCAVAPDKLLAFVKTLKGDDVDLILNMTEDGATAVSLTVKCGKAKTKFACTDDAMPMMEMLEGIEFKDFPVDSEKFLDIFHNVAKHVSTDLTRRILMGVFCNVDNGKLTLTATDGRSLASASVWETDEKIETIIQPSLVSLIKDDEITSYAFDGKYIAFKCKSGNIYCGRVIEGAFPNYKQVIPSTCPNKFCFPENYALFFKRAALVSETVKLSFTETECTITAKNDNTEYVETFDVSSSAPMDIVFSINYLLRVLASSNVVEFTDGNCPVVCRNSDSVSVCMPLRIS